MKSSFAKRFFNEIREEEEELCFVLVEMNLVIVEKEKKLIKEEKIFFFSVCLSVWKTEKKGRTKKKFGEVFFITSSYQKGLYQQLSLKNKNEPCENQP